MVTTAILLCTTILLLINYVEFIAYSHNFLTNSYQ